MFKQLNIIGNVNQSGIGFGLNISKILMSKLGGTFDIRNNEPMIRLKRS
jgi:C4-dicarboxylate-specific signal transduction histidine kinase